jgi:hypothetical protein
MVVTALWAVHAVVVQAFPPSLRCGEARRSAERAGGRPALSGGPERPHYTGRTSAQPPVPQPFPRPGTAQPSRPPQQPPPGQPGAPPAKPAPAPPEGTPTEATLGVPIYPGAQFLASYDAGRGQRYYIFGSAASFVELVTYYRTMLKQRGELVFDVPATHEFDVGRYREETMAFPPGVTIKDYQSDLSPGYPNPKPGGQPARFPTLIQIVPVTEK